MTATLQPTRKRGLHASVRMGYEAGREDESSGATPAELLFGDHDCFSFAVGR